MTPNRYWSAALIAASLTVIILWGYVISSYVMQP